MNTEQIWNTYGDKIYFFILKRMKDKFTADDVFQNAFFQIHQHLGQLKEPEKAKSWAFQIARNEINKFFQQHPDRLNEAIKESQQHPEEFRDVCCFDRFVTDLPDAYKEVVELIYLQGKKQQEVADALDISLANVKARIRRAKVMLKDRFYECCRYEQGEDGKLKGEANCEHCEAVLPAQPTAPSPDA